jgi:hypothetical protein
MPCSLCSMLLPDVYICPYTVINGYYGKKIHISKNTREHREQNITKYNKKQYDL